MTSQAIHGFPIDLDDTRWDVADSRLLAEWLDDPYVAPTQFRSRVSSITTATDYVELSAWAGASRATGKLICSGDGFVAVMQLGNDQTALTATLDREHVRRALSTQLDPGDENLSLPQGGVRIMTLIESRPSPVPMAQALEFAGEAVLQVLLDLGLLIVSENGVATPPGASWSGVFNGRALNIRRLFRAPDGAQLLSDFLLLGDATRRVLVAPDSSDDGNETLMRLGQSPRESLLWGLVLPMTTYA